VILGIELEELALDTFETAEADPRLTPGEAAYCGDRAASIAARVAAKTALFRWLGFEPGASPPPWTEAWIERDDAGRPTFGTDGAVARRLAERGVRTVHVSLTHDDGRAAALVLLEG
jgi:holo-[acyl-carrier protein] synthase